MTAFTRKQTVMLVGISHHDYLAFIRKGFEQNGRRVHVFEHHNASALETDCGSLLKRWRRRRRIHRINVNLIRAAQAVSPGLILFINGEPFTAETIRTLTARTTTLCWAVDAVHNVRIPLEQWSCFNANLVFEPNDLIKIPNASYMPYGFDPASYRLLPNEPKEYDLLFMGAPHSTRIPFLAELACRFRELGFTFAVIGPGYRKQSFNGAPLSRSCPELAACVVHDGRVSAQVANRFYNRSRIVLNIHHQQSERGVNARTFEIMASGALQAVDWHDYLETFFDVENDLVTYRTTEELLQKIEKLSRAPEQIERMAANGHRAVIQNHRFADRAAEILTLAEGVKSRS
jgi:spore maturation protein CgeB